MSVIVRSMGLYSRIKNVFSLEGFPGIFKRIMKKFYKVKLSFASLFNFRHIKSIYGVSFYSNYNDATFCSYITGNYGYYFHDLLQSYTKPFVLFDIGANQGLYTILAAQNPECLKVYSYEPVDSTFRLLEKNVSLNKVADKCCLQNLAVSSETGVSNIQIDEFHSGAATMRRGNSLTIDSSVTAEVRTIGPEQLSDFVSHLKGVDLLIKIDVEGFEEEVLETLLTSGLLQLTNSVFVEIDERWVDKFAIFSTLSDSGLSSLQKVHGNDVHYDIHATRTSNTAA